jgi:hypothetical protein
MRRFPLARRALMATTACSAIIVPVLLSPTAAWAESPNPDACRGLYHGNPPGSLVMTTNPPSGTLLHPGDEVEVTATWDTADWPGSVLHKVLDCLLIDGTVDYDHSSQEKPTGNDGLYRYRFTVPAGAQSRICDRVRLSGRLVEDGDLVVQKSNAICFSVAAAGKTGTQGETAEATTQAATPVEDSTPAPLEPADPVVDAPGSEEPESAPVPAAAPELSAVAYRPELPRTGSDVVPLARLGTLLVLLGGASLAIRAAISRQGTPSPLVA